MALVMMLSVCVSAFASPADHYARSSRLADGKWVRVSVSETGMQYISDATLRQMGFQNPSDVRVYGYGGRMLSENIGSSDPDDLPLQPSARTADGLVFFGTDYFDILPSSNRSGMTWRHVMNPYSEASYYFLSDSASAKYELPKTGQPIAIAAPRTTFHSLAVHEQDVFAPSTTGRILLGEDFRSQPSQNFSFKLPDNTGSTLRFKVAAGTAVTNGSSTFTFTVNGNALPAQAGDRINALTLESQYMRLGEIVREVTSGVGETLNLGIRHSLTGSSSMTRLDYVEVEYERNLTLRDRQLYFYDMVNGPATFSIGGCDSKTVIWDISDQANPAVVDFSISNGRAVFTVDGYGMKQFVAFNPGEFSARPVMAGEVQNQDIHSLEAPDYVIITPAEFRTQAEQVAALHRDLEGMNVLVLDPQTIYNEFSSGNPDVTAFRRMLKMWYDRSLEDTSLSYPRYCMLFSRPTYDNKIKTETVKSAGYPRLPIWQSETGNSGTTSYSTDDYIGMLADTDNFQISSAKIHVGVGRMPAKSVAEADVLVKKLTDYMKTPNLGAWRNNVMLIADDQDNGIHLEQTERVYNYMRGAGNGDKFLYERIYLDSYPLEYSATGPSYPEAKKRMLAKWKEGVMMINYIGHASTRSWSHEGLLNWTDIMAMSNTNLPFLYAATCEFGRYDDDTASGAEELVINPAGGVIATIVPSRTVFISQNGNLSNSTARIIFDRDEQGNAKRLGDILREGKNGYGSSDDNKLRYALIGDPALRLSSPGMQTEVVSIAGKDVSSSDSDDIVIGARSQVDISGRILDEQGKVAEDFDGAVYVSLYDAERPIETYGNGTDGKVITYNDRKTRLFTGRAKVEKGEWTIHIHVPGEIENNYSPALVSVYAHDENGREANGACENLYVYGYDKNAPEDNEGPEITSFYLNNERFTNGQTVHSSPLVFASFNDESGINLSEAGIGHKITLTLDGKKTFDDIVNYYIPDIENSTGGSLAYPLEGLEPGRHTLDLRVWDTANNSSVMQIDFQVGVNIDPTIFDVRCTGATGGEAAVFTITTDRPMSRLKGSVEVFDLGGNLMWSSESEQGVGQDSVVNMTWDLRDNSGRRVPRGIYVYRAGVTTPEGTSSFKSKKLAVSAPAE